MCTFIMSSSFFPVHRHFYMHTHTNNTFTTPPALWIFIKQRKVMSAFFFFYPFFFSPSSRSSFPECFLGALELQWHCRSRVGVAETRCRSSLGDFSQSIAAVSSPMICALSTQLWWTLEGEFANADFCLDVRSSSGLGVSRTSDRPREWEVLLIGLWIREFSTPTEGYLRCSISFCSSNDILRELLSL